MTVNRAQFTSLLEPKLAEISNDIKMRRPPTIYTNFYGLTTTSRKATETYLNRAGLGPFQRKAEGASVSFTDPIAGSELAFTHVRRSNGYTITQEMLDHDLYAEIIKLETDLQIAGEDDLEIAGHLPLNSGFSTTDNDNYGFKAAGFDSLALFSTAHTRLDGGTAQANRPSTDVNLGWTALANGIIQFMLWNDHRGRPVRSNPRRLIIHPNDMLTAKELLGSNLKPGTANNEINAIPGEGLTMDSTIVSQYLTDTNAWFIMSDLSEDTTVWHWDTGGPRTGQEDDWDKEIVKRKRVQGHSMGHREWYGFYGTSGTS